MVKSVANMAASVRARLLKLSMNDGQDFNAVLTRFALERLLFRLGRSDHADQFVLKGAMLLTTWLDAASRATRDVDLLGFGDPAPPRMLAIFAEILGQDADDGVEFDTAALTIDRIREELDYGGVRLKTNATIDGARIRVTVDVGFGDAIEPGIEVIDYPTMLDMPAPRLRAYPRETVIAEKFQAMVMLGRVNTRMKDFYDIWMLSRVFSFDDDRLARAIVATFERRNTDIPAARPDALSAGFAADAAKLRQWRAFIENIADEPIDLGRVVDDLSAFLMPHAVAARAILAGRLHL